MNNLLISPEEVLQMAFPTNEYIDPELIPPSTILTAQLQFIRPTFGPLYDHLCQKRYVGFLEQYIKPALACLVRMIIIDERCALVGGMGVIIPKTKYAAPAATSIHRRIHKQARKNAYSILMNAVRHVENHQNLFPEYNPEENILNHITLNGGFIFPLTPHPNHTRR